MSYAHFVRSYEPAMRERYTFSQVLRILIESREHFGGWSGNVRAWYTRPPSQPTIWLRFEDLVREPFAALEGAIAVGPEPPDPRPLVIERIA